MKIREEIIEKVKGNTGLKNELREIAGVSRVSIHNWLRDNDDNLTKAALLNAIAAHYNLKPEDLLEAEPTDKAA